MSQVRLTPADPTRIGMWPRPATAAEPDDWCLPGRRFAPVRLDSPQHKLGSVAVLIPLAGFSGAGRWWTKFLEPELRACRRAQEACGDETVGVAVPALLVGHVELRRVKRLRLTAADALALGLALRVPDANGRTDDLGELFARVRWMLRAAQARAANVELTRVTDAEACAAIGGRAGRVATIGEARFRFTGDRLDRDACSMCLAPTEVDGRQVLGLPIWYQGPTVAELYHQRGLDPYVRAARRLIEP